MPAGRTPNDATIAAARRKRSRRRRAEERESWTREDFFRDLNRATRRSDSTEKKS